MSNNRELGHSPTYRAYRVRVGERISTAGIILDAMDDEEAIVQATRLVDGIGIELWDGARQVAVLSPRAEDGRTDTSRPRFRTAAY